MSTQTNVIDPGKPSQTMRRPALRKRAAHPAIMLTTIACVCLVTMAFISMSGPVPASAASSHSATGKGPRILSTVDIACKGQSWGRGSSECLVAILGPTESKRGRSIRLIANADSPPGVY